MPKHAAAMMLLLVSIVAVGCGSSNRTADLADRSMEDVVNETDKLSVNGLEQRAAEYRDAIRAQNAKMQQLRQEEAKLDYNERTGPKALEIGKRMKEVGRLVTRLVERHQEYMIKLREKGIDTSEYAY